MPMPTNLNVSNPRGKGYHARINDLWVRLTLGVDQPPMIRREQPQAQRLDTATNPEDFVPETGLFFSINDFTGGEGLDYAHRPNTRPDRFWDSRGVDVSPSEPGRPKSARLLRDIEAVGAFTGIGRMDHTSDTLFVADGNNVVVVTDPAAAAPTTSTEDPHAGQTATDVLDVAVLTDQPYVALGSSGIHRRTATDTWEHWSDLAAERVWDAKGRILAAVGSELSEAAAAAGSTLLLTADEDIADVVDAGSHILVGAGKYIHALTFDEETLAILPVARTQLFRNEKVTSLAHSATGLLFIGTREYNGVGAIGRWYWARVGDDGSVGDLNLIRRWGDGESTADQAPYTIIVTRESAFTAVDEQSAGPHLWRYDLTTGGRSREHELDGAGTVVSLASVAGRLFASHDSGLHRESSDYVTTGYVITPLFDHHTSRPKLWSQVTVDIVDVPDATVAIYYSTQRSAINDPDHFSWTLAATLEGGESSTHNVSTPPSRFLALKVVLNTPEGDLTTTPEVLSLSSKAYPSGGDMVVTLPVNVGDVIQMRGHQAIKVPGLGRRIFAELYRMSDTSATLDLIDPPLRLRGTIEQVTTPVLRLGLGGSPTLVSEVVIRGTSGSTLSLIGSGSGYFGSDHLFGTTPLFGQVS